MNIEMYTSQRCSFCNNAKALLQKKNLDYSEIDISESTEKMREMVERSGRMTVPQIFIDGKSIGGFTELFEKHRTGELPDE